MIYWLIHVEKKDFCLFLLDEPIFSEIDNATAINEHKQFNSIVDLGLLNAIGQVRIGGDRVDLILNTFAFE